jgi:hypothetical protein
MTVASMPILEKIREMRGYSAALDRLRPWHRIALLLLFCLMVRVALGSILMNDFDRVDYVSDTHKTLVFGVGRYYEPTGKYGGYDGVPSPYPPLQIYCYAAAGQLYQRLFNSSFYSISKWRELPLNSLPLNYLIKAPIFLFELLLTAAIYFWLRWRFGEGRALACAALYGLSPPVLYDGALWEQPDSLHCFFLTVAVALLLSRRPVLSLAALALALSSKPQPAPLVPAIILVIATTSTIRRTAASCLAAMAAGTVVFAPYLGNNAEGVRQMLDVMNDANPVVSAQAHNLWWLLLDPWGVDPLKTPDSSVAFLGITYFAISASVLLILYGVLAIKIFRDRFRLTAEIFAFICMLFFTIGVRAHENHAIQVLPLLLLTGLVLRHQKVVFAALSVTILANMVLHSTELVGKHASPLVGVLRDVNAAFCVSVFAYWSFKVLRDWSANRGVVRDSGNVDGGGGVIE